MNCEDTRAAFSAAEGAAAAAEAEAHLASCTACRAWTLDLERLPDRLAEWAAPEPREDFETRVLARVRQGRLAWRTFSAAAQVAVFLLGAFAGFAGVRLARGGDSAAASSALEPALDVTDEYLARFGKER